MTDANGGAEKPRTSIFSTMKTDTNAEKNGIWVEFLNPATSETYRFRIARAGGANDAFNKKLEELTRPYRRQNMDLDQLPLARQEELWRVIYADCIILAWEGIVGEDGEPYPYNRENIIHLLKELPDVFRFLSKEANAYQNFRVAAREREAGN